ncbi:arginine-ornithine antiporter [Ancylobacter sp. TS-1]|uniref:arginine-ornithine antiporter n=1 Tax=Ancylobacter sp. TS-1 TaxID=1850374 RepID=UPI001265ACC3|nr:arginine-ornithine antiporter [Ancylobacter sp. TS-1]QFR34463.1 arginine-ornithine antiporter [Ancylobacter sp. TS-1]
MADIQPASSDRASAPATGKLTLLPLVALVVGSMIGGGVFNLPSDMSRGASPLAIIIGWVVTGVGMLMLAFVYQRLAVRKPELNAGPYAYAKAGFGDFVGFNSAWGYWISAFLGNVAYAVAIFSALSYFAPAFGDGNNVLSILGASAALWGIHLLVLKGVKEAAFVNVVTTIAKLVPILVFILVAIIAFNFDLFLGAFRNMGRATAEGGAELGGLLDQVKSTMLVTLWVFIGIEGASVYSARAANRRDVGRATVIGFVGALAVYVLVSLLATGIMSQPELAGQKVPSMAGVLEHVVGPWGAGLINLGLIISVGGAFLSWTLLCAEIPYTCGKDGTFPRWFAVENANGTPANSLWVTNLAVQAFLVLTYFSKDAYNFFYFIASVAILPPYVFSGAYALKLALTGESYQGEDRQRRRDLVIGLIATVYGLWLVYAAGLSYLLMATLLFVPGLVVYAIACRQRGVRAYAGSDLVIAIGIFGLAALAFYLLWTGAISPL